MTQADRECERMIARMLSDAFPDDGILGEEGARAETRSGRRWIIDPIDGTRDYVRGNPLWANLIALEAGGDVVVGVVNLPMLGKLYTASRGGGAHCNGSRIHASSKTSVEESVLCVNGYDKVAKSAVLRAIAGLDDALLGRARSGRRGGRDDGGVGPSRDLDGTQRVPVGFRASESDPGRGRRAISQRGWRFNHLRGQCHRLRTGLEQEVRRFPG